MGLLRSFVAANRAGARWLERRAPRLFGAEDYTAALQAAIAADIVTLRPATVLEVGGIDRPLLAKNPDFTYVGLDIEHRPDCDLIYDRFIVQSIEQPVPVEADMIISITVLEHVPDNASAARAMFGALKPGGTMHHYVPSKWHPYSVALRLVGPSLQKKLIAILRPEAVAVTGYPAFFDHCSPGDMERLLQQAGFGDIRIKAFYRASDYFAFFLPAYFAVVLFEALCEACGWRLFASGFVISAVRPDLAEALAIRPVAPAHAVPENLP
jgi:SAM-dependent methyltransferase